MKVLNMQMDKKEDLAHENAQGLCGQSREEV
jgi:hypothetical protein